MSSWTHITGTITVSPMGRTQHEMEYILKTVLDHLPAVTGSEGDMTVHIVQKSGYNMSSSHDEFSERTDNLRDHHGNRSRKRGWMYTQDTYFLVLEADLRDRTLPETQREFQRWLCRLAKRVVVEDILVQITDDINIFIQTDPKHIYLQMFEYPSWANDTGEPAWYEYLMWEGTESRYPLQLAYKYYSDPEIDKEIERRREWHRDTK